MTAVLTGLGIGLAFWIVTIPSLLIVFRNCGNKNRVDMERQIELMKERNDIDVSKCQHLSDINDQLGNISDLLLKDKQ